MLNQRTSEIKNIYSKRIFKIFSAYKAVIKIVHQLTFIVKRFMKKELFRLKWPEIFFGKEIKTGF